MEEKKQKWGVSSDTINEINKGIEPMNTSRNIDTERSGAEGTRRNLKPFDLESAKAGKPVCTRDGRKARIICFDAKCADTPIVALVSRDDGEILLRHYRNGKLSDDKDSDADLMMLPEKKEGWVNVYYSKLNGIYYFSAAIESKEKALEERLDYCIDTIKVEWEE